MNEHLKNANVRNKEAHKSHKQEVSFGRLCFYSLLKALSGRRDEDSLKDCVASWRSGLRALKPMKAGDVKGGQDALWRAESVWSASGLRCCFTGCCPYSRPETVTSKRRKPYYSGHLKWCLEEREYWVRPGSGKMYPVEWAESLLSSLCRLPAVPCRCRKSWTNGFVHRGLGRPWGIWFKIRFVHKGPWNYVHNGNYFLT